MTTNLLPLQEIRHIIQTVWSVLKLIKNWKLNLEIVLHSLGEKKESPVFLSNLFFALFFGLIISVFLSNISSCFFIYFYLFFGIIFSVLRSNYSSVFRGIFFSRRIHSFIESSF